MAELSEPRIVSAAIRLVDGLVIPSARHFDKTMRLVIDRVCLEKLNGAEQGFIDQHGTFYDRDAAWEIAYHNDQIRRQLSCGVGTLYSEHLY